MRENVVALVVRILDSQFELLEALSDDQEIGLFEEGLQAGEVEPLKRVYEFREKLEEEEEDFGNYVEDLVSQPFASPEIREHGIRWFESRIRLEEFRKTELNARVVIAQYAFTLFAQNPDLRNFTLAGPQAAVRVIVYLVDANALHKAA